MKKVFLSLVVVSISSLANLVHAQDNQLSSVELYKIKSQQQAIKLKEVKDKQHLANLESQKQQLAIEQARKQQQEDLINGNKRIVSSFSSEEQAYSQQFWN